MYTVYCLAKEAYKNPHVTQRIRDQGVGFGTKHNPHGPTKDVIKRNTIPKARIFSTLTANDQSNECVCRGGTLTTGPQGADTGVVDIFRYHCQMAIYFSKMLDNTPIKAANLIRISLNTLRIFNNTDIFNLI